MILVCRNLKKGEERKRKYKKKGKREKKEKANVKNRGKEEKPKIKKNKKNSHTIMSCKGEGRCNNFNCYKIIVDHVDCLPRD